MSADIESTVEHDDFEQVVVTVWSEQYRGGLRLEADRVSVHGDFNENPFPVQLLPLLARAVQTLAEQSEVKDAITLAAFLDGGQSSRDE